MRKSFLIVIFIYFIECSLIDYKECQRKANCSENLTPNDCPPGEFLDTQFANLCCHGCRSGIGWDIKYLISLISWIIKKLFHPQGRGESGCSSTRANKKCAPGLTCDDDFYCILDRSNFIFLYSGAHFRLSFTFHFQLRAFIRCTSTVTLGGSQRAKSTVLMRQSSVEVIS